MEKKLLFSSKNAVHTEGEQGSFANVNQEHQTKSDYVGGETNGRL